MLLTVRTEICMKRTKKRINIQIIYDCVQKNSHVKNISLFVHIKHDRYTFLCFYNNAEMMKSELHFTFSSFLPFYICMRRMKHVKKWRFFKRNNAAMQSMAEKAAGSTCTNWIGFFFLSFVSIVFFCRTNLLISLNSN